MAEKKLGFDQEAQALGEEGLNQVVGALLVHDPDPEAGTEAWKEVDGFFQGLGRGLRGEGIHSRESMEEISDLLRHKPK